MVITTYARTYSQSVVGKGHYDYTNGLYGEAFEQL